MESWGSFLLESLCNNIGKTVTIFTTSGGVSGSGFTGVLLSADREVVRLLCDVGAAPACPVGSSCTNAFTPWGNANDGFGFIGNPLGAVAVIPSPATKYTQLEGAYATNFLKSKIYRYIFPSKDKSTYDTLVSL